MAHGHMEFGLEAPGGGRRSAGDVIALPRPAHAGGLPLMEALQRRRSTREYSTRELPDGVLSSLLWAAFGINRPDSGGRTAPSAHDWEEIDLYVAMARGVHVYDAQHHALRRLHAEDVRAQTGMQAFAAEAPVALVYVADLGRMTEASSEEKRWYSGPDAGFIAQNVYLFCASEGLATVVRGMLDRPALARALGLRPDQQIILAQSVGYPLDAAA